MKVTGILLAAGASRRMGRDKLIISLGGRTVLRRSAEALLNGGVTDIIIAVSDATRQEAQSSLMNSSGLMEASREENSSVSTIFTPSSSIRANFSASTAIMAGGTLSGRTPASG